MAITSSGLVSGINVDQLVTQLIALEKKPVTLLESRQKDYELKIASLYDISTKLSTFKSALDVLNSREKFNTKTASVTKTSAGDDLLSVSASSAAAAGSYSIQVNQLAKANKEASQGWADQNTTGIASASGSFKFKVGSGGAITTISISTNTTLQGLRDAINSASSGVTASIINDGTGSNPYRLILTADDTGSSNSLYITQNDTNLDFTNKKVEAAYAYTTNSYTGTVQSNEGNNYTGTTNKTFLIEMVSGGAVGAATYKYSTDGGITWLGSGGAAYNGSNAATTTTDYTNQWIDGSASSNSVNENVKIQFSAGTLASGDKFSIDVFNPEMQSAQDAVIEIDNSTLTKSTNTITDVIQGVTLNLLKADASSALTLTVSSDTSGAKNSIKSFVDAYNTVNKFLNDQLSYDPETQKKNPLLGDPTLLEIRRKIANAVTGSIPGLTSGYTGLSQVGITSDSKTGKLSLNDSKLSSAISSDPDAVAKLFIGTASATNAAVSFLSKTSSTQPGTYSLYIATAPEKATLLGGQTISSSGITAQETLTFMYSNNYSESAPDYTTFSVTFNAGTTINSIVDNLNSTFATNNVRLSASNESGKVRVTSTDYGADIYFKTTSSTGNVAGQIGFNSDGSSYDAGINVAGSINNHAAEGIGNILTAKSGFEEEGLKISIESNLTGGFGTVTVSSGIADRLSASVATYTDTATGIFKSKTDSMDKTIDRIKSQIERIEDRLEDKEKRLRDQFVRLEALLAKYNTQSQYLTSQLANLPKIANNNK